MKKLFILCGAVAIVAALTGIHATKVQKRPRIIELQDSCIQMLSNDLRSHNHNCNCRASDDVNVNKSIIDSLDYILQHKYNCDIPCFDGDIKILIEEEINKLNNNN